MHRVQVVAAAWGACTRAAWTVDLADPVRLATVRARIIVVGSGLALASTVGAWLADPASLTRMGPAEATATLVGLGATGTFAATRGRRMPDLTFLGLMVVQIVFADVATALSVQNPAGLSSKIGMGIVPTVIVGAVFSGRRWHVAAEVAVACALLLRTAVTAPVTASGSPAAEVTDPLTGLRNRRGLERVGSSAWQEHARVGEPLALLAIDVDHFKAINDTSGHAAGDVVLRRLAEIVSANLRVGDVAVRLGGEEFLVLCEASPVHAELVAERLRDAIERELAPVTVSIGVHVAHPQEQHEPLAALWSAVDVADRALYWAKTTGRNRVVTLDPT